MPSQNLIKKRFESYMIIILSFKKFIQKFNHYDNILSFKM